MPKLPAELLVKVFHHLPRHERVQCSYVCKSWYAIAVSGLNAFIVIKDSNHAIAIRRQLTEIPTYVQGSDVRHLSIVAEKRDYIPDEEFVRILKSCENLKILEFIDDKQASAHYLNSMVRHEGAFHLKYLRFIRVPCLECMDLELLNSYTSLAFIHRQTLIELTLNLSSPCFYMTRSPNNNLGPYLSSFSALKHLTIQFSCSVVLHDILDACPQLETLIMHTCLLSAFDHFRIYSTDANNKKDFQSHLQSLTIDSMYISKQLFDYLIDHAIHLQDLEFKGPYEFSPRRLFGISRILSKKKSNILTIKSIKLNSFSPFSPVMMKNLASWFPALQSIHFYNCQFGNMIDRNNNMLMDFSGLNLGYLSLDLHKTVATSNSLINKVDLEIVRNEGGGGPLLNTVLYYQKKWGHHDDHFTKKECHQYVNATARNKRFASKRTIVITIKVKALNYIRLYSDPIPVAQQPSPVNRLKQEFDQMLHLNF